MLDIINNKITLLNQSKNNELLLSEVNDLCESYSQSLHEEFLSVYSKKPLEEFYNDFFCTKLSIEDTNDFEKIFQYISNGFCVQEYKVRFDESNKIWNLKRTLKKIHFFEVFHNRKDQNDITPLCDIVDFICERELNSYNSKPIDIELSFPGSIRANKLLISNDIQYFNTNSMNAKEKQLRYISNLLSLNIEHNILKQHCRLLQFLLKESYLQFFPLLARNRYEIIEIIAIVFRYAANKISPILTNISSSNIHPLYLDNQDAEYIKHQVLKLKKHLSILEDLLKERQNEIFNQKKNVLYIYKGNITCLRNNHNLISATANITDASNNEITLNVEYCRDCHLFLLEYTLYLEYKKKYGTLIGNLRIISNTNNNSERSLALESPLHLSGYNVNSINALSSSQRKYILECMLYNNIMSKNEIIRYLAYFIRVNGAKKRNNEALKKWQEDLDFVQSIDLDKQPQYYIDKIEKY
jgi:hypothetical protein